MDDIKPNQSLDGMSGGRGNQPTNTQQNSGATGGLNQFNDADYAPETNNGQQNYETHHQDMQDNNGGGSSKMLKVFLTIFIILFVAAAAAAGYFYMESNKEAPQAAVVDVSRIQQENESLTYDNKTLTTQNTQYQVQIKSLTTTAEQLKTKCGTSCKAIVIPQ